MSTSAAAATAWHLSDAGKELLRRVAANYVERLQLDDTELGFLGVSAVAQALQSTQLVRILSLQSNGLRDADVAPLRYVLTSNKTLETLDLRPAAAPQRPAEHDDAAGSSSAAARARGEACKSHLLHCRFLYILPTKPIKSLKSLKQLSPLQLLG